MQMLDIKISKGALTTYTYTAEDRQGKRVYGKAASQQHLTSLKALEEEAKILSVLSGKHLALPSCVELYRHDDQTHLIQVRELSALSIKLMALTRAVAAK